MHRVIDARRRRIERAVPALAQRQLRLDFLLAQQAVRSPAPEADVESSDLAEHVGLESHVGAEGEFVPRQPAIVLAVIENREAGDVFVGQPFRLSVRPDRINRPGHDGRIVRCERAQDGTEPFRLWRRVIVEIRRCSVSHMLRALRCVRGKGREAMTR